MNMDNINNTEKERFNNLCKNINRDGIDRLLEWLETTDYFTAPASTKYHDAYTGGLLHHSLRVYDNLNNLLSIYPSIQCTEESKTIISLFHDLCKVNFYKVSQKNHKNENGKWEVIDYYTIDEEFCYGGHGSKSVFMLLNFMKLSTEEAVAINCHMASWDSTDTSYVSNAYQQFPLAWILHVADEAATYLE